MPVFTRDASQRISEKSGDSPAEVELTLRTIGYLHSSNNLEHTLHLAARLKTRWLAIKQDLPFHWHVIDRLVSAGDLANYVNNPASDQLRIRRGETPSLDGLWYDAAKITLIHYPTEEQLDLIAVLWLVHAIARIHPTPVIEPICLTIQPSSFQEFFIDPHAWRVQELGQGLIKIGLKSWVDAMIRLDAIAENKPFQVPIHILRHALDYYASTPCDPCLTLPSTPSVRPASIYLHERWLTSGHWYSPTPAQEAALKLFFNTTPSAHPSEPNFFESLIICIAYATAKPIRAVLEMHFCGNTSTITDSPDEYLAVSTHAGHKGLYYRGEWSFVAGKSRIALPLPERVSGSVVNLLRHQTKGRLVDLLPPTPIDWARRCEHRLAELLECTPRRANLIVRDALLRAAYQQSQNLAAVYWLSTARGQSGLARAPALTHYLDPQAIRLVEIYRASAKQLFGAFGSYDKAAYGKTPGEYSVGAEAHWSIAKLLAVRSTSSKGDLLLAHNAFTKYTLTLLIAATGHRNSQTPFFFPWDFDFEHHLVFIADKCTTGSEARFLPLAETAERQVQAYFRHLRVLHDTTDSRLGEARRHIASILNLGNRQSTATSETSISLFFTLDEDGKPRTLGTGHLSTDTAAIAGVKVGRFRAALADYLWSQGCSGLEISAFLGHSDQNHPFGPASTWTTLDWSEKLRPLIDDYLRERGWKVVAPPAGRGRPSHQMPVIRTPQYATGVSAYEGRQKDLATARSIARRAIQQVLSDDFLADASQTITDDIVRAIEARTRELLQEDEAACRGVRGELAAVLSDLRKRGIRVNSARMNLARIAECPVETQYSRHLALSRKFRRQWIENIGAPLGGQLDAIERVAQLTISLIVFDGVLDQRRLRSLISILNEGESGIYFREDLITLRTQLETAQFEYAWSVVPGTLSCAQLIGILETRQAGPDSDRPGEAAVLARIGNIAERLLGRLPGRSRWTLEKLIHIFKPWWFLRQPGTLHAIAIGDHNGPAPHLLTESSLYARHEPLADTLQIQYRSAITNKGDRDQDQKTAHTAISRLLKAAAGDMAHGTAHTRTQRAALKRLNVPDMDDRLSALAADHQIIELVAAFAKDLVETGGKRIGELRFSSIRTYLGAVSESLIRHGWDLDFGSMDTDEFEALYAKVEGECKDKQSHWFYALTLFHRFLRDSIDAPYVSRYSPFNVKSHIRTALATPAAVEKTLQLMKAHPSLPPTYRDLARGIIVIGAGYGTRISECSGLQAGHFDVHDPLNLRIQRNVLRDLKSTAARRRISFPLLVGRQKTVISTLRERAAESPDSRHLLFATAERDSLIHPTNRIGRYAMDCLRSVAGNPALNSHDLRRSFATRLTLLALPQKSDHPALTRAWQRLIGDDGWSTETVRKLVSTPTGNPYLIDGIARALGHANTKTLLDVYFVASSLALADITFACEKGVVIDDLRLANMLGRSRTSIVRMRQRITLRSGDGNIAAIVRHYLNTTNNESFDSNVKTPDGVAGEPEGTEIPWAIFDRLLCLRQQHGISREEFMLEAERLGVQQAIAREFLDRYIKMVTDTGFDDFEPKDSELLAKAPRRLDGVQRGRKEREAALERIQELIRRDKSFQLLLASISNRWMERTSPDIPLLVCTSTQELREAFDFLTLVGAQMHQFEILASPTCPQHLLAEAHQKFNAIPTLSAPRFSRGPANVRVAEIGISIRQRSGSHIPDGRDMHRLLAVLYCTGAMWARDYGNSA